MLSFCLREVDMLVEAVNNKKKKKGIKTKREFEKKKKEGEGEKRRNTIGRLIHLNLLKPGNGLSCSSCHKTGSLLLFLPLLLFLLFLLAILIN